MSDLYASSRKPLTLYKDRKYQGDQREREQVLSLSKTLYVGNLSFYTSEEQIFDVFSKVGEIKRIIMGLDRIRKTPCGFCFVEYFMRDDAEKSVQFLSGTKVDERQIRVDYDIGFAEGRQYGRGKSGGQVRDEHRVSYDPGRGGYGKAAYRGMTGMEMWGYDSGPPLPMSTPGQYFHNGSRNMNTPNRFRGGRGPRIDRGRRRSFPGRFQPPMMQAFPAPPMFMPPPPPQQQGYRRARSFNDGTPMDDQQFKRMRQGDHSQMTENGDEPMRNERLDRGRSKDEE